VAHLSNDDIKQLDQHLRLRREALLGAIRNRLHRGDEAAVMALDNPYADVREQAEADLLADTDIGQLQLELADLQAIDEALARVAGGIYGVCTGCGGRIALRRLRAQPAARMCLSCQEAFEQHRQAPP
jgi:DnaK suppressor protein